LEALADGEDGLLEVEGVLHEELVHGGAVRIGRFALRDGGFAILLGVDVGGGAREKDAVAGGENFGDALGRLVERNGDGRGSGGIKRVEVLGQRTQVVGGRVGDGARAGGLWDGDVDGHGFLSTGIIGARTRD
jgi:hypothetical protein